MDPNVTCGVLNLIGLIVEPMESWQLVCELVGNSPFISKTCFELIKRQQLHGL